jgi:hypothetical protein
MAADLSQLEITSTASGVEFAVKVVPGASRTRIIGLLGGALKLAVAAPPEGGKANEAVVELLAKAVGVKRGHVAIAAGHTQPQKRIAITGCTAETLYAALARCASGTRA